MKLENDESVLMVLWQWFVEGRDGVGRGGSTVGMIRTVTVIKGNGEVSSCSVDVRMSITDGSCNSNEDEISSSVISSSSNEGKMVALKT